MLFLQTLSFFKMLLTKPSANVSLNTLDINIGSRLKLETDIYQPLKKYRGTILFIHGMNKYGKNDERVKHFCSCLAAIGYRVIVPTYPAISQHILDMDTINDFEDTIVTLTDNQRLCPKKQIAIFTVSFSGTLALRAASRITTYKRVSAFFTIGSGFYLMDVFKLGLERTEHDSYMKKICVKNVVRSNPAMSTEIIDAIDIMIDDAFLPNEPPKLPEKLMHFSAATQEFIKKISERDSSTAFLYQQYKDHLQKEETTLFSSNDDSLLIFPIILMHSVDDAVLPARETLRYSEDLIKKGIKPKVFVTSLLEHVNHKFSISKIPEIIKLVSVFYYFFKRV